MEATFPHIKKLDKHVALIGPTKLEAEKKHGIECRCDCEIRKVGVKDSWEY